MQSSYKQYSLCGEKVLQVLKTYLKCLEEQDTRYLDREQTIKSFAEIINRMSSGNDLNYGYSKELPGFVAQIYHLLEYKYILSGGYDKDSVLVSLYLRRAYSLSLYGYENTDHLAYSRFLKEIMLKGWIIQTDRYDLKRKDIDLSKVPAKEFWMEEYITQEDIKAEKATKMKKKELKKKASLKQHWNKEKKEEIDNEDENEEEDEDNDEKRKQARRVATSQKRADNKSKRDQIKDGLLISLPGYSLGQ